MVDFERLRNLPELRQWQEDCQHMPRGSPCNVVKHARSLHNAIAEQQGLRFPPYPFHFENENQNEVYGPELPPTPDSPLKQATQSVLPPRRIPDYPIGEFDLK